MATELFTQCAGVLFDAPPSLDDLERALEAWPVAGRQAAAAGEDGWIACGPGLVVELRSGAAVLVDVVDRPWPDGAGAGDAPAIAAAWRSGLFGPTAAPGALARAAAQSWAWEGGAGAAASHRGFVRLRTVVTLPDDGAPRLPDGHDPLHELMTLTELAQPVLRLRGATALFMPGGEALRSAEQVETALRRKTGVGPPPIDLWTNLRAMGLGTVGDARWVLVDTVGMGQLRLPDEEALFVEGAEEPGAVAPLLRNASLHLAAGKAIPDGSTSDDAGGRRWKAALATSALAPERPVLRWIPQQSAAPGPAFLARLTSQSLGVAGTGVIERVELP